jgi:hypothetical protein
MAVIYGREVHFKEIIYDMFQVLLELEKAI